MSRDVPEPFAATARAVEAVCSGLGAQGAFSPLGANRWVCDVRLSWAAPIAQVAFILDIDGPLLAVYVTLHLDGADGQADALAKALARANYGLLPGCFELDLDTGETRYRSVLELPSGEANTESVAQLVSRALQMVETYSPAFKQIIESGADPLTAVDEIESQA
jgi:hypothetical protein